MFKRSKQIRNLKNKKSIFHHKCQAMNKVGKTVRLISFQKMSYIMNISLIKHNKMLKKIFQTIFHKKVRKAIKKENK
jgi:hypothetical protein